MKESRRKVDEKQLRKKRKILATVIGITSIIVMISFLILGLLKYKTSENSTTFSMEGLVLIILDIILGISYFVMEQKIYKKIVKIQKDEITEKAREDKSKKILKLKNEDIIQKILSTQIKQIILRDSTKTELKAEVLLENNTLLYPICFPKDKLLSLIDKEGKDRLLEKIIDSITIEELEDEMVRINIKPVKGKPITLECCYEELIECFEIKK